MEKSIEYVEWLHKATILGYNRGIVLRTEHATQIEAFFKEGMKPNDMVEAYRKFLLKEKTHE